MDASTLKPINNSILACLISCALLAASLPGVAQTSSTPICVLPDSDTDGDGWGWEDNQSCRVAALAGVNTQASVNTSGGTPACALQDSDPDNDGWGWENNRSCRVVADTPVSEANSDTDTTNSEGNDLLDNGSADNGSVENDSDESSDNSDTHPVCESSDSDSDNDGWGWENNASCRVLPIPATFETDANETPATAASHVADSVTIETPVTIMPVGDSITHGVKEQSSYRKPLNDLLMQSECSFTFVGSQASNHGHDDFVSPHEGYSGHTADHFLDGISNSAGDNRGISDSMERFEPDVVLLHLGTNDSVRGHNVNQTVAELDQIIAMILLHNPSATVLLANVIPWYRDVPSQLTIDCLLYTSPSPRDRG